MIATRTVKRPSFGSGGGWRIWVNTTRPLTSSAMDWRSTLISVKLLRHCGHRYITIRKFDLAIASLQRAAEIIEAGGLPDEIEPDGQPNRLNIPTSTTQTNIYYHLGLTHYLKGEFASAESAYRKCMARCGNDDIRIATTYWLVLALQRQGKDEDCEALLATIPKDLRIIENHSYYKLLHLFKGKTTPEQLTADAGADPSVDRATIGYGLAMHQQLRGAGDAKPAFIEVIENSNWAAFGHIAAEAELARLRP